MSVMSNTTFTKSDFDKRRADIAAALAVWHERECTSFDDAVTSTAPAENGEDGMSIWDDMPLIDSKRAVSALVEIEEVTGVKLPTETIQRGGYATLQALIDELLPALRAQCPDAPVGSSSVPRTNPSVSHAA
jgi:hypothetical protein